MEELLYEGKAKKVFRTPDEGILIQEFKNSATAFNGQKKAEIPGKAELNEQISSGLLSHLNTNGIKTHFIESLPLNRQKIFKLKMIPLEVVVRNRVAGSLAKRSEKKEGDVLDPILVEFFLKDDAANDPQLSEADIKKKELITERELDQIKSEALNINKILLLLFKNCELHLVDFKLEFGKNAEDQIVLGDEISPDTCRLWDIKTGEKLDKDRFRFELGDLIQGYQEIWSRLKTQLKLKESA